MANTEESSSWEKLVASAITTPDEELSLTELRARWKFQSPAANLVPLGFGVVFYAVTRLCEGEWRNGLITIAGAAVVATLINASQNYRAKRMTREQLIADIKNRREIHQEGFDV